MNKKPTIVHAIEISILLICLCLGSYSVLAFSSDPLSTSTSVPKASLTQDLKIGDHGSDVGFLQSFLASDPDLHFQPSTFGTFGPRTFRALKAFQGKNGILPTGIADTATRSQINSFLSAGLTATTAPTYIQKITMAIQNATTTDSLPLLIEFNTMPSDKEKNLIKSYGGTIKYVYHIVPAIAAVIPKQNILNLAQQSEIKTIELDQNAFKRSADISATNTMPIAIGTTTATSTLLFSTVNISTTTLNIAVIDSGIDYTHPDLAPYYAGGHNFINNTDDAMDDNNHGTHVAGIILRTFQKFNTASGTTPAIKLYSLKVLDSHGSGFFSDIIAALEWAVDNHMNITNNSYGTTIDPGQIVLEAFNNADHAGILTIAAAGNSGSCDNIKDSVEYPARYPSVMAVAAIDSSNDARACFSSTGQNVEIAAPGVAILSTKRGGGYVKYSGTSMAAPYVAGGAAVLYANTSFNDKKINSTIRTILDQSSDDVGIPGRDVFFGFGLIDIAKALQAEQRK